MSRPGILIVAAGILIGVGLVAGTAHGGEDPRTAETFLTALREKGMYDLASEYIERLRNDPGLGQPLKGLLDYHEGRALIDEASHSVDLARRRELLDRAAGRLGTFVKDRPEDQATLEALIEIARSLFERGHLARLVGEDSTDAERKKSKADEARDMFGKASDAYGHAAERLSEAHKKLAGFLERGDPRIAERDRMRDNTLDARLKQGLAMYEKAQTFAADSKERADLLSQALARFDEVNKDYRQSMAGFMAQTFQGKCYEEQGKIGEAIGLYKAILDQTDARLRDIKRTVHYFYIVALTKRQQFPLAADEAVKWLQTYDRREERRSMDGMGVYYELARSLDAQITKDTPKADREAATKKIVDALSQVVRMPTPFKNDAVAMLKKYKPGSAIEPKELARLSFDEAALQADEAMGSREWGRAVALLRTAVAKAGPRQADKIDLSRFHLAYALYMDKKLPEAEVAAGWLARNKSRSELAPPASALASQAILDQYNNPRELDRPGDLDRYIDLAKFTVATWPTREEADEARMLMGQIHQGRGEFNEAAAAFASVPDRSPRRLEAQTRLGGAHWAKSRNLARAGDEKKPEADAEAAEAVTILKKALDDRKAAGAPVDDAGYLGNAADLGSALTESGKPDEAIKALKPIVDAQKTKTGPAFGRLMESYLLAQVGAGQVEAAIASMRAVEASGDGANRTQLYYRFGRLLETELERLTKANQPLKVTQLKEAYRKALTSLAESKSGQTFETLRWAAEGLLSIDASADAEAILRRVIADAQADPNFLKEKGGPERLLRAKVKLATALRAQKKFDQAASQVDELLADQAFKNYLDPQFEKGELLDAQAEAGQGSWNASATHWQDLAQKLGRVKSKPPAFYEAWYRAAIAMSKQKQNPKARQTLTAVMRLNPTLGTPEMKEKYESLLTKLK